MERIGKIILAVLILAFAQTAFAQQNRQTYSISGENSLEARAGISLHMAVSESISKRIVNEITADEEQKRERDKTAALTIYYADAGENLWSIARNYCTSVEAIKMQNDLADDVISARGMILIPM